jgi:hypothetical protein
MILNRDTVDSLLAMMLRDYRRRTTADRTVAFLDGERVRYAYQDADCPDLIDEECMLTEKEVEIWRSEIEDWFERPRFTYRPEVLDWLRFHRPV